MIGIVAISISLLFRRNLHSLSKGTPLSLFFLATLGRIIIISEGIGDGFTYQVNRHSMTTSREILGVQEVQTLIH